MRSDGSTEIPESLVLFLVREFRDSTPREVLGEFWRRVTMRRSTRCPWKTADSASILVAIGFVALRTVLH